MRPSKDENMLELCKVIAKRTTCVKRGVGCVITNEAGHILATGYNGVAKHATHCIDKACPGANIDGKGLCEAIHAEQNAIAKLVQPGAYTLYCSTEPCTPCTKLILAAGIKRVVFGEKHHKNGKHLFEGEWICIPYINE